MTTIDHDRRTRVAAACGGAVLSAAAILTAGTGIAAASVADTLRTTCTHYVPNPVWNGSENEVSDCSGAKLAGTNLVGAVLSGADLTDAKLVGTDLSDATLRGADLGNANLTNAELINANLSDANLKSANLTGANLTGANLADANLSGADLTWTDLTGTDLTKAKLTGTSVVPANIRSTASSADGASVTIPAPAGAKGVTLDGCTRPQNVAVPMNATLAFPVGTTTVTCTVHSIRAGSPSIGSGTFTVTVSDRSSSTGSLGSLSLFGS